MSRDHKDQHFVAIVPSTHWDRAWYLPFEVFRRKLVQMFDRLIDLLETDPDFTCFVADGQTVVLDDYLAIRPEKRQALSTLIRQGRLFVGPWYVLPDEFLVSGESLIRNLKIGIQSANEMGYVMKVGYVPDPFGHIGQLPQILQGCGIDSFVFSRGYHQKKENPIEFYWQSPDGSRVLAIHQHETYINGANLGYPGGCDHDCVDFSMDQALDRLDNLFRGMRERAVSSAYLINNGIDHLEAQPQIPTIVQAARRKWPEMTIKVCGLEEYMNKVKESIKNKKLNTIKHELSYPHGDLLKGVYSARVHLKQWNRHCENLLLYYAEPLEALATFLNPIKMDERSLLEYSWKLLMKNQPHDDICGCSVDRVHEDMENRFVRVEELSQAIYRDAFRDIANAMNHSANGGIPFVIYNPTPYPRDGAFPVKIMCEASELAWFDEGIEIIDSQGNRLDFELVSQKPQTWMEIRNFFQMTEISMVIDFHNLPPSGFQTLYMKPGSRSKRVPSKLTTTQKSLENQYLKVTFSANGTFSIKNKTNGTVHKGLGFFEDTEDCGDEYNWSDLPCSETFTTQKSHTKIEILQKGKLSSTIRVSHSFPVPVGLKQDRTRRSKKKVNLSIISDLTLREGSQYLEIKTSVINKAKNHRLRAVFPTDTQAKHVYAGGHFDTVKRVVNPEKHLFFVPEKASTICKTEHFSGFVALGDKKAGFGILAKGLCEYEAIQGKKGIDLAVTLFRSVDFLSRGDFQSREDIAGPELETPAAQMMGEMEFHYAIYASTGSHVEIQCARKSLEYALELVSERGDRSNAPRDPGAQSRVKPVPREGICPDTLSLFKLSSKNLVLTSLCQGKEANTWEARFFNPTKQVVNGKAELPFPAQSIWTTNMLGEKIKKIGSGKVFQIRVNGKQIFSILLEITKNPIR